MSLRVVGMARQLRVENGVSVAEPRGAVSMASVGSARLHVPVTVGEGARN